MLEEGDGTTGVIIQPGGAEKLDDRHTYELTLEFQRQMLSMRAHLETANSENETGEEAERTETDSSGSEPDVFVAGFNSCVLSEGKKAVIDGSEFEYVIGTWNGTATDDPDPSRSEGAADRPVAALMLLTRRGDLRLDELERMVRDSHYQMILGADREEDGFDHPVDAMLEEYKSTHRARQ